MFIKNPVSVRSEKVEINAFELNPHLDYEQDIRLSADGARELARLLVEAADAMDKAGA